MKRYNRPEVEILKIEVEDVITLSVGEGTGNVTDNETFLPTGKSANQIDMMK